MRARGIKPGFFTDAELLECSRDARLLAIGLWTLADKRGRLKDKPKQIKIDVFPCEDDLDIDALLGELEKAKHIVRYEVDGLRLIQVRNFEQHQNPHRNEKDSELPALPYGHGYVEKLRERSSNYAANPADSGLLNTDSGLPTPETNTPQPPKGGGVQAKTGNKKPQGLSREQQAAFAVFWAEYPKKRSKGQAEKAWAKISPDKQLRAEIMGGLRRAKTSDDWRKDRGQYVPHPATWLNAKGWEDEYAPRDGPSPLSAKGRRNAENAQRALEKLMGGQTG